MNLLALAVSVAEEAGALLLERFRNPARGVGSKSSGTDMVSDADRDAEASIVSRLHDARPNDAILGEEGGATEGSSGFRWIIDPLDGTTNFLYGRTDWCVSIACEDPEGMIVGAVHDPIRQETFAAERGHGATLNGERIFVSDRDDLESALVVTGFSYKADERSQQGALVARVLPAVRDIRRSGAAALDLAWVACGRADAYYELALAPWDIAAGTLLVREAGGLTGTLSDGTTVAAGPGIFADLRELVSRA